MNFYYLKIIFGSLGFIYFFLSLITKKKLHILTNIYEDIYLYIDVILAFSLLFIVFVLDQYVAVLPLGLLVYNYLYKVPVDNFLWFSADGLAAGVLLSVAISLTRKGKLCNSK